MENQMTVDEQLERMNETEFKAFLEACCTHKTKNTSEHHDLIVQLDPQAKTTEVQQHPPLATTAKLITSSLQSLNKPDSINQNDSQIHLTSKSETNSTPEAMSGGVPRGPAMMPPHPTSHPSSNNNTHHHHPVHHLNSSFSSNNNSSSVNNTTYASTSLSTTGSLGNHTEPLSNNSQNQHTNCIATNTMVNNSHPQLYTPSSYYSPTPSSPSHTEEDTATTSANSDSSSPSNNSTTTVTSSPPLTGRQYHYHSHHSQSATARPAVISPETAINFNLKRPPAPKSVSVQNHIEVTASATLPSPYFFNARTAGPEEDDAGLLDGDLDVREATSDVYAEDCPADPKPGSNPVNSSSGSFQLGNDYASRPQPGIVSGVSSEFGSYSRPQRISPRSSRSGTPVHGETASASLSLGRRSGGIRNKKPKETILAPSDRSYIGDQYENIEDLLSYINGEPEKSTQTLKKPKKKTKRKETLSKSHSLDENTLGTDVNPSIETRSVSSTLLENKSDENTSPGNTTAGLDLSAPSESLRVHSSTEFITVTNRKKNKALKGEAQKSKLDVSQQDDIVYRTNSQIRSEPESGWKTDTEHTSPQSLSETEINPAPKQKVVVVPKPEPILSGEQEPVLKQEPAVLLPQAKVKAEHCVTNKETVQPCKLDPIPVLAPHSFPTVANSEHLDISNQKEPFTKLDPSRKQELSGRRHQPENTQPYTRKYPEPQRRPDGIRRTEPPPTRRPQDLGRRKDGLIQPNDPAQQRRQQFSRHDSEPRQFPNRYREPVSKSVSLSSESMVDSFPVKCEEAVKFCGVNFENKSNILEKPNFTVEFGFGVTDVLTKLATATPSEVPQDDKQPSPSQTLDHQLNHVSTSSSEQSFVPDETQTRTPEVPQQLKQPLSAGDASLLGRHPQSGQSPPIHYLPMSVPLSLAATGYQFSGANYYQTIQQQVPVGVVQYYPGPHMQPIQQISAPIMTAIPTQGTQQQQFMNPLTLTQQHQLLQHQHQQLLQQQQHAQAPYNAAIQQQIIQYPVMLKSTPQQQQYSGNQQGLAQYPSAPQNSVPPHAQQQAYSSQGHAGNFNYHRNTTTPRSNHSVVNCNPQMGTYGMQPHQSPQQYGPSSQSQYLGQNPGQGHHQAHNYNPAGPPVNVHYGNYHRNNNSRSNHGNMNSPGAHSYGSQPSPQGNSGSGQHYAQSHSRQMPPPSHQNPRSLPSQNPPAVTPVSLVVNSPSPDQSTVAPLLEVAIFVNPDSNPLGQYYILPSDNEDYTKYAKSGQEYMNTYVEKLSERIERGATVHRL